MLWTPGQLNYPPKWDPDSWTAGERAALLPLPR